MSDTIVITIKNNGKCMLNLFSFYSTNLYVVMNSPKNVKVFITMMMMVAIAHG